ncbi:MAG: hypothetical protein C0502_11820 [Opitutus sp.]|nr:hypothetical protein [Opitutus sp.]
MCPSTIREILKVTAQPDAISFAGGRCGARARRGAGAPIRPERGPPAAARVDRRGDGRARIPGPGPAD